MKARGGKSAAGSVDTGPRLRRQTGDIRRIAALGMPLLVLLASCGGDAENYSNTSANRQLSSVKQSCLPPEVLKLRLAERPRAAPGTRVYIDGSQSMSGYLAPSLGRRRPLADLLTLIAREGGTTTEYFSFGREIQPIEAGRAVEAYSTPAPYNCSNCDNQESRIDAVLGEIAAKEDVGLAVVITDLWLDNRSFAGNPQVALGGPLQEILRKGHSIGVIGIQAPFAGPVYDVPGFGTYRGAKERPLFILAIGDDERILALRNRFRQSGSPALENTRFALFSSKDSDASAPPPLHVTGGGGVTGHSVLGPGRLANVPQYAMSLDTARARQGTIRASIDLGERVRDGFVWHGPIDARAQAWKLSQPADLDQCNPDTWRRFATLQRVWRQGASDGEAIFELTSNIGQTLVPPGTYFVLAEVGTSGLAVPNPDAAWMREWSISSEGAQALAAERSEAFKALDLASFAELMERQLADQLKDGRVMRRLGFVIQISH